MTTKAEYVRCRTLGHAWDVLSTGSQTDGASLLHLRCTSCTTLRDDNVAMDGSVKRRYVYPEGYRRAKDATDDRPTKAEWRLQFLSIARKTRRK
jgi:hypothetical protein